MNGKQKEKWNGKDEEGMRKNEKEEEGGEEE